MTVSEVLSNMATILERDGFTVDRHCWPWFAYKGPRFAPHDSMSLDPEWPNTPE